MPKSPIKNEKHSILIVVSLIIVLAAAATIVYVSTPDNEGTHFAQTHSQS
jgi:flagellar basal body-associated protein FliL